MGPYPQARGLRAGFCADRLELRLSSPSPDRSTREGLRHQCGFPQNAGRTRTCRAFRASPISLSSLACSRRQLVEQRLRLFQIECIEAFGEPAVDRSEEIMGLIP